MHPMTRLRSPDLLDQGKNSLFEITCGILYASLPLILCFELNVISSIINMYLIGIIFPLQRLVRKLIVIGRSRPRHHLSQHLRLYGDRKSFSRLFCHLLVF